MNKFLAVLITVMFCTMAWSVPTEIKPVAVYKGSVAEVELQKNCPDFISDAVTMQELWQSWKIKEKVPEIDFAKQIVLISTTVGSVMNMTISLDEKGDMKTFGMSTMDFGEGFRYLMSVVSREGVKTVNGKELPTTRKILPLILLKGSVVIKNMYANSFTTVIPSQQKLKKIWLIWKLTDKMPKIDFTKQIVVLSTGAGSILYTTYAIEANGNLKVDSISTKDIADGFRYQFAIINKEGIKTVNGKELQK